jgi:hypothetical protein
LANHIRAHHDDYKFDSGGEHRRAVRLYFPDAEFRAVRIAAAEADLPMSEFCRRASMMAATEGLLKEQSAKN